MNNAEQIESLADIIIQITVGIFEYRGMAVQGFGLNQKRNNIGYLHLSFLHYA